MKLYQIVIILFLITSFVSLTSYAEKRSDTKAQKVQNDTKNTKNTKNSEHDNYLKNLNQGNNFYKQQDYAGALEAYRRAAALEPDNPEAHFFVGTAQKKNSDPQGALNSFKTALRLATEETRIYGKILFNIALVNMQLNDMNEARTAWQNYIDWGESHRDLNPYIANAREIQQSITDKEELNRSYEIVRQRISQHAGDNQQQKKR